MDLDILHSHVIFGARLHQMPLTYLYQDATSIQHDLKSKSALKIH